MIWNEAKTFSDDRAIKHKSIIYSYKRQGQLHPFKVFEIYIIVYCIVQYANVLYCICSNGTTVAKLFLYTACTEINGLSNVGIEKKRQ